MTAQDAVNKFIKSRSIIGLGGQNINRCPMALVHEIIRQRPDDLTIVGCNLSLPLDMLAAAGLVTRTEQGSGNLERYGSLFSWRRLVEDGHIVVRDYSHLGMASRFLGGALGLPHMPTRSLLGSDLLRDLTDGGEARIVMDPWTNQPVALLQSAVPDVSIIHASQADPEGNTVIHGVTSHETDMVLASRRAIVSAEEIVDRSALSSHPEVVTISGAFVDAVVPQPFGAFPTSVYRRYDYSEPDILEYQAVSRDGTDAVRGYLAEWVLAFGSFEDYLERRDPDRGHRRSLEHAMRSLL